MFVRVEDAQSGGVPAEDGAALRSPSRSRLCGGRLIGMPAPDARFSAVWDDQAATYDARTAWLERRFLGEPRATVCGRASGDVLELGIGTGANLPHYRRETRLTGLDFSPAMLRQAQRRASGLRLDLRTVHSDADALPFADASFDAVVATYLLCSVPSVTGTLAEIRRVLRPGGRLLLADHVAPTNPVLRWAAGLLERSTAPRYGEHFTRRPLPQVEEAGFTVQDSGRRHAGAFEWLDAVRPD